MGGKPLAPHKGLRAEDRRILKRLIYGALGSTLFVIWASDVMFNAPLWFAFIIGLLLLCFDTVAITLVWALYQRR
jgi:hypothetical protein